MNDTALPDAKHDLFIALDGIEASLEDARRAALASPPAQAEPATEFAGECKATAQKLRNLHKTVGNHYGHPDLWDAMRLLTIASRAAPAQAPPEPGLQADAFEAGRQWGMTQERALWHLAATSQEIDRLHSSLECEKRLRKDAEERREELLEAQACGRPLTSAQIGLLERLYDAGTEAGWSAAVNDHENPNHRGGWIDRIAEALAAAPTAPERPAMLSELLKDWSEARAVDGIKHHECMRMVQVGDRMLDALQRFAPPEQPEVRLNDDGTLDEVVGIGAFHLEQMAEDHWWMEIENSAGRVAVWLTAGRGKIAAIYEAEPAAPAQPVKGER